MIFPKQGHRKAPDHPGTPRRAPARASFRHLATAAAIGLLALLQPGLPAMAETGAMRDAQATPSPVLRDEAHVHLTVFFGFDDDRLAPAARRALDRLAPRLRDNLARGGTVLVDGHTDAAGSAGYNLDLSERRARAVARYLHEGWQVSPRQLVLRAWGQDLLRRPADPRAAENRRVEITLIAPGRRPTEPDCVPVWRRPAPGHLDLDDFGGARRPPALSGTMPVFDCTGR